MAQFEVTGDKASKPVFGWFRPSCPVDLQAKAWIEDRLLWLAEEFGLDVFASRPVILPTEEFFPDEFDGSDEAIRALLDRVCCYMGVRPEIVECNIYADRNDVWLVDRRGYVVPPAVGAFEGQPDRLAVHLSTIQLDNPMALVGTMPHELAHLRLLGERRIPNDAFDGELLTDLTVVFHGLGIFLANLPRAWPSGLTAWPGTDVAKPEYMTEPMFAHALAHAAWFRGERKPAWAKHLWTDARANFKPALRYLWETGDSRFKPNGFPANPGSDTA